MAEASQDSRPSDGKRERHQTLAGIRAQTPAKFNTHSRSLAAALRAGPAWWRSVERRPARHEARNEFAAGEGRRIPVDFRGDSALNRRP